jgi:hypothetical protein
MFFEILQSYTGVDIAALHGADTALHGADTALLSTSERNDRAVIVGE